MADLFGEKVINIPVEEEITKSYIDYSMSVIIGRALPDIRDGLKPVHRRILYAMEEMSCLPSKPHKKSARIVGEVLGKFHPHGDIAVYDALVRMAQPFSLKHPLIDGHGNFGSIDGDSPAAMRYTEVRLDKIAIEMLEDLNENTVDFIPNFDNTLKEPVVLPAKIPNLLINGSSGIAVGMATNIPPHNLLEISDALIHIIDKEILKGDEVKPEELYDIIKGPDFPTSGIVVGREGIKSYFDTGRGSITIRGKAHIEEKQKGKRYFVITELPFSVNKAELVEKIANLAKMKKLEGIEDLRDESDRDGIRVVIKLSRETNINIFENRLRLHTLFEKRFGIILLGILNNVPKVFSMKDLLTEFLLFRKDVLVRKTSFELNKAKERLEILEGLGKAIQQIDDVIKIIRASKNTEEASRGLKNLLSASDVQIKAILEMKLSRLTNMEIDKLNSDIDTTRKNIDSLTETLEKKEKQWALIKEDLLRIKARYGTIRKTDITASEEEIDIEDIIENKKIIISATRDGYIKRLDETTFKLQHRGGKGVLGQASGEEDYPSDIYTTSTKSTMLFFTNTGKVYSLKAYKIPESRRESKGTPIHRLLQIKNDERISATFSLDDQSYYEDFIMVTRKGKIKKVKISAFANVYINGKRAIGLKKEDELVALRPVKNDDEAIIITQKGYGLRFNANEIRSMGTGARGVIGIRPYEGDEVKGMEIIQKGTEIFLVTKKGFGKRLIGKKIRKIRHGGKGVKCAKIDGKAGEVQAIQNVTKEDIIFVITKNGNIIKIKASTVPILSRTARGVRVMKFKTKNDEVASIAAGQK
jgi:DNA gyrase subunit A